MRFDHVGIPNQEPKAGAVFVPATRVWVTDAHQHPFQVEWLRFEADSPVTGPLREMPHVGFRVDSVARITELSANMKTVLEPFDAGFAVAGFYQTEDGAIIELVYYREAPGQA